MIWIQRTEPDAGSDEYGNYCERGTSKARCIECGGGSKKPRSGWWVYFVGDDEEFACQTCTHASAEVA